MEKFAGRTYFYLNTGYKILWVSPNLVKYETPDVPYIEHPLGGAKIEGTKNGRYIICRYKGRADWSVFHFVSNCEFSIVYPFHPDIEVLPYKMSDVWKGAFVSVKDGILIVSWKKSKKNRGVSILGLYEKPVTILGLSSYDEVKEFAKSIVYDLGLEIEWC
jgi:hypothetical protein